MSGELVDGPEPARQATVSEIRYRPATLGVVGRLTTPGQIERVHTERVQRYPHSVVNPIDAEREMEVLERRLDRAMLEADVETLAQLLGDALVYTFWSGTTDGKTAYVERIRTRSVVYHTIERAVEHIQVYTDVAVVTGRAHVDGAVLGLPRVADVRFISVWANGSNGWQLVAYQATPL
jgi:hypothetical protein